MYISHVDDAHGEHYDTGNMLNTIEFKHAPGPWRITPAGSITSSNHEIVIPTKDHVIDHDCNPINDGFGRASANARLIAAAPELLEMLERFMALDDWSDDSIAPRELSDSAHALVRKVKGGKQ